MIEERPILYVEDLEDDALLMARACAMAGIRRPLSLADGAQAIGYLSGTGTYEKEEKPARPALVLLDLHLPGISGFEVLMWIRSQAHLADLPVLALTSSNRPSDKERCMKLGANGYLVKPQTIGELAEMITGLKSYWGDIQRQQDTN